jgi:phage terminase large subunit
MMATTEIEMHVYTGIEPTTWQTHVLEDEHQFKVICAGRRTGKTLLALMDCLMTATTIDGANCWYVAPTYGMAKSIAWGELKAMVEPFRPTHLIEKISESELQIKFRNGSMIQLKGADYEDSLRGVGLDLAVLDEYAVMKPAVWEEILRPSIIDRNGKALFIFTPKGYNHAHRLYVQETKEPQSWKSYHFQTIDNPHIDKAEIEQARRDMDPRAFRQEFCASFEVFGGQVFSDFDRKKHVADKPIAFVPGTEYALGMDFGWSAPTVVLFINVLPNEDVQVFAELGRRETSMPQIALDIKNRPQPKGMGRDKYKRPFDALPTLIGCDPAGDARSESLGTSSVQELRNIFGYNVVKYRRNYPGIIQDGINQIRKWLRNGKLKISPQCTNLIQAFEMYRYPDPKGDIQSEQPLKDGISDHWIDALRYFFLNRFPVQTTSVRAQ